MQTLILRKVLLSLLVLTFPNPFVFSQKTEKKETDKYRFSTGLTWEYVNEFDDIRGEMTVYVDTVSGSFLFTKEAYGTTGYGTDFIIGDQEGIFISGYTDENGAKTLRIDTLETVKSTIGGRQYYDEDFAKAVKPTGAKKVFGKNSKKWPTITGEEYRTTFDPPTLISLDYLAKMKFTILPVYHFNQRQMVTARLPYNFSGALHMDYLLLENTYESEGKRITIILKSIMPAEQVIDLQAYKK